jgi:malate dehydrogenase (oxaloacetate-decarboxylating)
MVKPVGITVDEVLDYHRKNRGKFGVISKSPLSCRKDLSLAYTPGVAEVCRRIHESPECAGEYTSRDNMVAVVSDGTAVLGLGDVGPLAGLPVMEGKAILFKMLAGVDAVPVCLNTKDEDELVGIVKALEPSFGGVNLEDISAPRCFSIEGRLRGQMGVPVFHDDQHGTAIVTLAGLINALKLVDKKMGDVRVVFNGAGASGMACARFYMNAGVRDVIMCDSRGVIYGGRVEGMNQYKEGIAKVTNGDNIQGGLADAIKGADVFVGLSVGGCVTKDMIASMNEKPVVFALANPTPEIMPDAAYEAGAQVVATGRSDLPNQVNNVLGFPGVFRGALDARADDINEGMKLAAAYAIASQIPDEMIARECIIPSPLDEDVIPAEAAAVAKAAVETGAARRRVDPEWVKQHTRDLVFRARRTYESQGIF